MRIVGVEGEKERLLEDFTNPERPSPVVATTSKLLSTGIDVQNLRYVVLFRPIGSMTEFKQIVGRGTRLYPDQDKHSFDVIDYVGASKLFNDPEFDGFPPNIVEVDVDDDGNEVADGVTDPPAGGTSTSPGQKATENDESGLNEPEHPFTPGDPAAGSGEGSPPPDAPPTRRRKLYVDDGDFMVDAEAVLVPSTDGGRLILTEYGQLVRDHIRMVGADADSMARNWSGADSRHALIQALKDAQVDVEEIVEAAGVPDADPLDALVHMAWDLPVLPCPHPSNSRSHHPHVTHDPAGDGSR